MITEQYDSFMVPVFARKLPFAKLLRACRDGYGLKQVRAAEYLKMAPTSLRRLENAQGGARLPEDLIERLRAFYRIPEAIFDEAYAAWVQDIPGDPDTDRLLAVCRGESKEAAAWAAVRRFPPRILKVYEGVANGRASGDIAKQLGVEQNTIRCYLADGKAILHSIERNRAAEATGHSSR